MPALTANDVTITLAARDRDFSQFKKITFPTIAFGDGAKTYPANGVPLPDKLHLGCPKELKRLFVEGNLSGYIGVYDPTNHTMRLFQSGASGSFTFDALAAHTHDIKLIGGITATEPVAVQGGDTLGKNAATNRTIAGADSATKGGVVAASAGTPSATGTLTDGPLGEMATGAAVPALTFRAMAVGE